MSGPARQRGFMDFSVTELVITFGVALVALGPKKLPGLVAQVGRWVGRARVMARQFREQLEQEVNSVNNAVNVVQPVSKPPPLQPDPPVTTAPATEAAASQVATAAVQSFHADSPTHFKLDGTTPSVSFSNPLDDSADAETEATAPPAEVPLAVTAPEQDVPAAKT